MPAPGRAYLWQRACWWSPTAFDPFGVRLRQERSTEIACKWQWTEGEATAADGEKVKTDATVNVEVDVPVGSFLWLGSQDELAASVTGTGEGDEVVPDEGITQVVNVKRGYDLRGNLNTIQLSLMRYTRELPDAD